MQESEIASATITWATPNPVGHPAVVFPEAAIPQPNAEDLFPALSDEILVQPTAVVSPSTAPAALARETYKEREHIPLAHQRLATPKPTLKPTSTEFSLGTELQQVGNKVGRAVDSVVTEASNCWSGKGPCPTRPPQELRRP